MLLLLHSSASSDGGVTRCKHAHNVILFVSLLVTRTHVSSVLMHLEWIGERGSACVRTDRIRTVYASNLTWFIETPRVLRHDYSMVLGGSC